MYKWYNKHSLLCLMIFCYIIPILYVCFYYQSNHSVSNIICNVNYKTCILCFMILMGLFTILYEVERNDFVSILSISILLGCIYGLIIFDESYNLHYIFAVVVFVMILLFNIRHSTLLFT